MKNLIDTIDIYKIKISNKIYYECLSRFDILSEEEKCKISKFKIENSKKRFIITRVLLRLIIAKYIKLLPNQISFSYGLYGKPRTKDVKDLFFNITHSEELILVAISLEEIGIDLEFRKSIGCFEEIAETICTFKEYHNLFINSLLQYSKFLDIWVKKEALFKAIGIGICDEMREVKVLDNNIVNLNLSYFNIHGRYRIVKIIIPFYICYVSYAYSKFLKILNIHNIFEFNDIQ